MRGRRRDLAAWALAWASILVGGVAFLIAWLGGIDTWSP